MAAILCFAFGHWLVVLVLGQTGPFAADKVQTLFDLDAESAPGAYFASVALLVCAAAGLLAASGEAEPSLRRFWLLAAAIAAFLSLDEAAGLHERLSVLGRHLTGGRGVFTISWWTLYPLLLAPIVALLIPGILRLDRATRGRLMVAGAVFFGAAVGVEIVQSLVRDEMVTALDLRIGKEIDWARYAEALTATPEGIAYQLRQHWLALIEEPLEMTGVALALRATLLRAGKSGAHVEIAVVSPA